MAVGKIERSVLEPCMHVEGFAKRMHQCGFHSTPSTSVVLRIDEADHCIALGHCKRQCRNASLLLLGLDLAYACVVLYLSALPNDIIRTHQPQVKVFTTDTSVSIKVCFDGTHDSLPLRVVIVVGPVEGRIALSAYPAI